MKTRLIRTLTLLAVWACVGVDEGVEGTQAHSMGSHDHMRQHQHQHKPGTAHHYKPRRQPPPTISPGRNDPKRLPKEEPPATQNLLQDNELFHDREHLKEELPQYMNLEKVEEMSDKELDFHYFRMHDFDGNLRLDGLELLAALAHVVGDAEEDEDEGKKEEGEAERDVLKGLNEEEQKVVKNYRHQKWEESWKFYIQLVDGVMEHNDENKDGFIDWREFLKGRNRPM